MTTTTYMQIPWLGLAVVHWFWSTKLFDIGPG